MQVYFIRHAQSTNNALWDQNGSGKDRFDDPELTEMGKKQLTYLKKFMSAGIKDNPNGRKDYQNRYGYDFTHLYASPMIRALQTGLVVSETMNKPLTIWTEIHEGGGIFLENEEGELVGLPGKPKSFFEKEYPQVKLPEDMGENGWWNRPFEPYSNRMIRAEIVWKKILNSHKNDDRVALFSHGGFFNYFISYVLKRDLDEVSWFDMNNVGISRFDVDKDKNRFNVVYVNKTEFLPDGLIT